MTVVQVGASNSRVWLMF